MAFDFRPLTLIEGMEPHAFLVNWTDLVHVHHEVLSSLCSFNLEIVGIEVKDRHFFHSTNSRRDELTIQSLCIVLMKLIPLKWVNAVVLCHAFGSQRIQLLFLLSAEDGIRIDTSEGLRIVARGVLKDAVEYPDVTSRPISIGRFVASFEDKVVRELLSGIV